jgi:hypothetical protein
MVWFKVDDKFHSHAKVLQCSNAAIGVWTKLGSWCAEQLNGGRVTSTALKHFRVRKDLITELVAAGLWLECCDGADVEYVFHDWDDHQPAKDQVLARRKATKERVARHRNAVTTIASDDAGNAVTNGVGNAAPVPSRPVKRSIPSLAADAYESGGGGSSSVRSVDSLSAAGRMWVAGVMGRDDYDHRGKWGHPLAVIAQKPDVEKRAVAAALGKELGKNGVRRKLTPQHILDYWAAYVDGQPPGARSADAAPQLGAAEIAQAKEEFALCEQRYRAADPASKAAAREKWAESDRKLKELKARHAWTG